MNTQVSEPVSPGAEETHFNVDSWGGWIRLYRTHAPAPDPIHVRVAVGNPYLPAPSLEVHLVGPHGRVGSDATLAAGPRAEVGCKLPIAPDGPCRRQPSVVKPNRGRPPPPKLRRDLPRRSRRRS